MKKQNVKGLAKSIARSIVFRCAMAVVFAVVAVMAIPAFVFMDINPVGWDGPARFFSAACSVCASSIIVLLFSEK